MKKIDSSLIFKNGAKFKRIDNNYSRYFIVRSLKLQYITFCIVNLRINYKKKTHYTSRRNGHEKFDNSNKHVIFLSRQP